MRSSLWIGYWHAPNASARNRLPENGSPSRTGSGARGTPPSAACEFAAATSEPTRAASRERTEGERGCAPRPAPRPRTSRIPFSDTLARKTALRPRCGTWQIRLVTSLDWSRVAFTEHMTEAAEVVAECDVVLDFEIERATYAVRVYRPLKGASQAFFAVGTNREDPQGFRPVGEGPTPEDALQACLNTAGVYHRRRVKQAGG